MSSATNRILLDSCSVFQQAGASSSSTDLPGCCEVNDLVHGTFTLGPLCSLAEDTRPVQRLRHLKQLGPTCYGPFPGAVHSRHEHSLGAAHLSAQHLRHLATASQQQQGSCQDVRQVDVELTALAGLCHDLGHGPFSHSFDTFLERLQGHGCHWHHEAMSCRLLQAVLGEAQLDLDSSQVAHVQDMIDNSTHSSLRQPMHPAQAWRLQVVSNAVNSLDMDKVDYLVRDTLLCGVALQQDCRAFLPLVTQHCRVVSGHVCFDQRHQQAVADVFDARAALFEHVYQHRQAKAAELMIADALLAAEPVLQICQRLEDVKDFLTLDDSLLSLIQASARVKGAAGCMQQAAATLQRLQRRDTLYQWAAEAELAPAQQQQQQHLQECRLSVEDVVRCQQQGAGVLLRQEDVRLQHYNINYSLVLRTRWSGCSFMTAAAAALAGRQQQAWTAPARPSCETGCGCTSPGSATRLQICKPTLRQQRRPSAPHCAASMGPVGSSWWSMTAAAAAARPCGLQQQTCCRGISSSACFCRLLCAAAAAATAAAVRARMATEWWLSGLTVAAASHSRRVAIGSRHSATNAFAQAHRVCESV